MNFLQQIGPLHLVALIFGVAVASLLWWLKLRRDSRSLQALTGGLRSLARGDFSAEVEASGSADLRETVRAFNETAHTLTETRERLSSYQRALEERVREKTRELNSATARMSQISQTDAMTSLPNRFLFTRKLEEMLKRAANETSRAAVLFVDLDYFKGFNDSLGHETGDAILRTVADRLKTVVRQEDFVARFGGDEFVVLLPKLGFQDAEDKAVSIAEDIMKSLMQPLDVAGSRINMPASIGVAVYPQDGRTAADLIKNADAAMIAAKQAGRNRVERFADTNAQPVAMRAKLDADIRRGIAAEEFFLVFQPQVDISTGSPVGLEALLRWRHPSRGVIGPIDFITAAEQSGLIHQLGQRALEMACEQFKFWQQRDIYPRISVNVSARQLDDPFWLESVRETIEQTKIPAQFLDLEITESMLVSNPDRVIETLTELNQLGVTLTLDDFGTGYSSLSYLTRLPFHTIKIDRSFMHDVEVATRKSIVQAIVAVAHSLDLRVIAEGVESPLQLSILRDLKVEEGQGYYFAKPLDAADVENWWTGQLSSVSSSLARP
ncbi:MAG: EAL domain-containing protein [Burkholderiales bacterium]|nr:MAG: EAL domain-containing protein [Burkholderiales bacterium]TAG77346.1 MAG: EAL domain-containing protein [Betaproteobacteria bacterium]